MSEEVQLDVGPDWREPEGHTPARAVAAQGPRCLDCLDALLAFPPHPSPPAATDSAECRGCRELLGEPVTPASYPASVGERILLIASKPDAQPALERILVAGGGTIGSQVQPPDAANALIEQQAPVAVLALPFGEARDTLLHLRRLDPEMVGLFAGEGIDDVTTVAALRSGFLGCLDLAQPEDAGCRVVAEAVRLAGVQRDRRKLRESLIRERNRYRTTIHHLPVGVVALDRELSVVSINPLARRMTGLDLASEDLPEFLQAVIRDAATQERVSEAVEEARAERTATRVHEVALMSEGGREPRTVEISAIPVDSSDRSGISVLLAFVDLTQERELARTLAEKDRLASIGQMAASVAHELRNPLAGISGAIDILLAEIPPNEDLLRIRREVQNQLRRLTVLSSELLNFAKTVRVQRISVTVRDLVDSVATTLSRDPDHHRIQWEIEGGEVPIEVDGVHFPAVLLNLAVNAVQATGKSPQPIVAVRARSDDGDVVLQVEDEGSGFGSEALEEAFRPFFTTKARGTGLGLPTCRKIVEAHGGTIRAENRPEGGGRVIIRLPRSGPALG